MKFNATINSLRYLENAETITVRDIIGLFSNDILGDLREEGYNLTKLELGNAEEAIPWLGKIARTVIKINENNREYFESDDFSDLWSGVGAKIRDTERKLSEVETFLTRNKEDIIELRKQEHILEDKEKEYSDTESLKQTIRAAIDEKNQILEETAELQKQLNQVTEKDIPAAKEKYETALREYNDILTDKAELEKKLSDINNYYEEETETCRQIQSSVSEKEKSVQQLSEKIEECRGMLKNAEDEYKSKTDELEHITAERDKQIGLIHDTEEEYKKMKEENETVLCEYEKLKAANKSDIDSIRNRFMKIRELAANWEESADIVSQWSDRKAAEMIFAKTRSKIDIMENELEMCRIEYEKMLNVFEGGSYK